MNPQPLAGLSILFVEDDAGMRVAFERFLTSRGATVRGASSAEEGLKLFKVAVPDVVIADLWLPGHDGVWLLDNIRTIAEGIRVPVIALTGMVLPTGVETLLAAGFDGHLEKPVNLDNMTTLIMTLNRRH